MATTVVNKNIPLIHKKEPQFMSAAPVNTAAGSFVITDLTEEDRFALFVSSSTVHHLYDDVEDGWIQIPSGALGGTFGAGSCGARTRWSSTITANGGSTSSATTTANINGHCIGKTIRILTGAAAGLESTVTNIIINPGGTNTIQFTPIAIAVANTNTFVVETGTFHCFNGGTLSATSFRSYDLVSNTWTSRSVTGLPTTFGTDAKLVATTSDKLFASGTATSATATTLVNSSKTWTVNQWSNYQVRITAGTGIGQVRTITSNTATTLTVPTWTTNPDATSQYVIEGNDDFLYLLGNNAVTMYRYSISGNTWTTLSPGVARTGAPSTGMSANWISQTGDPNWANESDIDDGRFIYSFRGGAGALLDRYDIALNTWVAVTYTPITETFTTGSSYAVMGNYIYIRKESTGRMFKYSVIDNFMYPIGTTYYPEGAAVLGDKMWGSKYVDSSGNVKLKWLYYLQNTGNVLHRILLHD